MAARLRKHHQDWRFYVYAVFGSFGELLYVGKGSGKRMGVSQKERGGHTAHELAYFRKERDAYAFEVSAIAEMKPALNVHVGGNGSRAKVRRPEAAPKWARAIDAIGSRKYAARLWLSALKSCMLVGADFPGDLSKVEQIRRVAYG